MSAVLLVIVYWLLGGAVWIAIMLLRVRVPPVRPWGSNPDPTFKKPPPPAAPPPPREPGMPRVTTPPACDIADGTAYYFEDGCGNVLQAVWSNSDIDRRRCAAGNVRIITPTP